MADVKIQLRGVPSRWLVKIGAIDNGVLCSCSEDENASTHSTAPSPSPSASAPLPSSFQPSSDCASSTARTRHCSTLSARAPCVSSTPIIAPSCSLSMSSAGKNAELGAICACDMRTLSCGNVRRKSRAAFSTTVTTLAQSGPPRACARPSASTSRHSSNTCEVDTVWPKNSVAVSGNWCASSKMMVLADGSNSATPVSFKATSAKNRWWLTTTMSACWASRRAFITKQSW